MVKSEEEVLKLADLVDYQKDSIVSRTLIDKKTGTITLFAFDEGQGLSEHTAPFDAMTYVIEGEAEISIADKALRLEASEAVIMPADKPHAVKATKRFKMLLIMIRS
ncbi:MAG: cupin domain-containing protein [Candidatus Bathyarchaeales archaeon]